MKKIIHQAVAPCPSSVPGTRAQLPPRDPSSPCKRFGLQCSRVVLSTVNVRSEMWSSVLCSRSRLTGLAFSELFSSSPLLSLLNCSCTGRHAESPELFLPAKYLEYRLLFSHSFDDHWSFAGQPSCQKNNFIWTLKKLRQPWIFKKALQWKSPRAGTFSIFSGQAFS